MLRKTMRRTATTRAAASDSFGFRCGGVRGCDRFRCARAGTARRAASTPSTATAANPNSSSRAERTSDGCPALTRTPASAAPNAFAINWTVLIAADALPLSRGSATAFIAPTARCGHAMPMPAPATTSPVTHTVTAAGPASSRTAAAMSARPRPTSTGALTTMRRTVRGADAEALGISPSVHPTARAAPRKPAASGARPARRCPNNGTNVSAVETTASTAIVRYTQRSRAVVNVAAGRMPCGLRRSTATNATTAADATASRAIVGAPPVTTAATLTARAAAVSRASETSGILPAARDPRACAGRANGTAAATASVQTSNAPNAHRQAWNWANTPPTAGPAKVPTPHIADTSAAARLQRRSGRALFSTA